ncbi:hypothetical protein EW145_g5222 [Phellinidium pouzarii]|uniref:Hydantoinase/oxoprolinase N-terminal domain-containing protein n=1 Tax=Phellinidium pouzarii TaxID=167371 RepID=A0A4S4L0N8_9AGAM|nr:hypothetical protein EW145_g5222 [Phellinidium pouzarii]
MSSKYRIGIDVGGTNTDAVILKSPSDSVTRAIVAWHKSPTTPDVTSGIASALEVVLHQSQIDKENILYLSIGTTHFLNAVIEADPCRLSKIAVIRLSGPYTARCPPFIDFPSRLRAIMDGHVAMIDGGLEIDGKEIKPISDTQLKEQCNIIRSKGIKHVVIVGVFSPLASAGTQEEYAKRVIEDYMGKKNISVVCSKDVGQIGLLERENASILNASILSFARRTVFAYYEVMKQFDLKCPLYLTQLDGTLVPASIAATIPIRTFSNGPTNSMRGAAFLAGLDRKDVADNRESKIVIDVGGTTTDVGVLLPSGFPRKAAAFTNIGGVRTSFSMPDIHSIGLGGGSRVRFSPSGAASVGPDSVGHAITSSALVFGGETLTATDLAVAAKLPETSFGDSTLLAGALTGPQAEAGIARITQLLESAIDKMKTEPGPVSVLLVGGGSVVVPPNTCWSIARISGVVDRVEIPGGANGDLDAIVERCKKEAIGRAVAAGADERSVDIAEVTVVQLPYVANHASRIVIRAVGDLDISSVQQFKNDIDFDSTALDEEMIEVSESEQFSTQFEELAAEDPSTYRPSVSFDGVWTLSETDMEWLAEGCAVLGCGGGGATYAAFLMARQALRSGRRIRVVSADYLLECTDADSQAWIMPCGFMGSPSVSSERIPSGQEIPAACTGLMRFLGIKQVAALISIMKHFRDEIGGKNGLEPMLLAARNEFDLPVIDGDLMGRAYPKLNQIIPCIYKENGLFPVSAADGVGNCIIVPSARNNPIVEDILRAACTVLGSSMALSISPLHASELKQNAIAGTTSQAWRIGRAIAMCRKESNLRGISDAITSLQDGKCLFVGKIIEVKREVRGGFTHGQIIIGPLLQEELEGPTSNENLSAELIDGDSRKMLCSVPDLIAVLDAQNGSSIGTQDYRYGLRVVVLGLACDPRWMTPEGLVIGGPKAFGLDIPYTPIGKYTEPRSVIQEYCQQA